MATKNVLETLDSAARVLKAARSQRRAADTNLARAEATQSKAIESEHAAEAAYKAARTAVAKAFPEHERS
jgi:hypothetical protein